MGLAAGGSRWERLGITWDATSTLGLLSIPGRAVLETETLDLWYPIGHWRLDVTVKHLALGSIVRELSAKP